MPRIGGEGMRLGELRVSATDPVKNLDGGFEAVVSRLVICCQTLLEHQPGIDAVRRIPFCALPFGLVDFRRDGAHQALSDLVLHCEQILEPTVITLRPDRITGKRVNQLGRHPDTITALTDAAL